MLLSELQRENDESPKTREVLEALVKNLRKDFYSVLLDTEEEHLAAFY